VAANCVLAFAQPRSSRPSPSDDCFAVTPGASFQLHETLELDDVRERCPAGRRQPQWLSEAALSPAAKPDGESREPALAEASRLRPDMAGPRGRGRGVRRHRPRDALYLTFAAAMRFRRVRGSAGAAPPVSCRAGPGAPYVPSPGPIPSPAPNVMAAPRASDPDDPSRGEVSTVRPKALLNVPARDCSSRRGRTSVDRQDDAGTAPEGLGRTPRGRQPRQPSATCSRRGSTRKSSLPPGRACMRTTCPGPTLRIVVGGGSGEGGSVARIAGSSSRSGRLPPDARSRVRPPQSPCLVSSVEGGAKTTFLKVTTPAALLSLHFLATAVTFPMTCTLLPGAGG
jgi:hypothetical protein